MTVIDSAEASRQELMISSSSITASLDLTAPAVVRILEGFGGEREGETHLSVWCKHPGTSPGPAAARWSRCWRTSPARSCRVSPRPFSLWARSVLTRTWLIFLTTNYHHIISGVILPGCEEPPMTFMVDRLEVLLNLAIFCRRLQYDDLPIKTGLESLQCIL